MSYTINQLAKIAGVSVRTLHHYDQIGLLSPRRQKNGYRVYEENELLLLQQIMFFRELEFELAEIKKIIHAKNFNMFATLNDQKSVLQLKKKRLNSLIKTIDMTLKKINKQKNMKDDELYSSFSKEESEEYAREAKERWGNTAAYRQSKERVAKMSKEDMERIGRENDELLKEIVSSMDKKPADEQVQKLIRRHYENLRHFYEPNLEMYRGLGNMYVDDPRFTAFFDRYKIGLAQYMRDAINIFCDSKSKQ